MSNQNVLGPWNAIGTFKFKALQFTLVTVTWFFDFTTKTWQTASPSPSKMSSSKSRVCNVEMALLLAKINPSSDTRSCTQCTRQVPKTQLLLTCEHCREKQKRKKARRKERQLVGEAGISKTTTTAIIDEYEREEAAKAAKKPSKKKREDWDKIEVEMGEDWDSMKERLKAEMAAAKGTSGKKRKAEPYGPLYAAGLAHDRAVIAECMAIVNAAHANASSPPLSVPPRRQDIMEPLLKRQVKLFRFWFHGRFIMPLYRNFRRWYHPSYRIFRVSRLLREARSVSLRASVVQSLDSPSSQDPMSQNTAAPANQATCNKQNPEQLPKPRVIRQATLGSYFKSR